MENSETTDRRETRDDRLHPRLSAPVACSEIAHPSLEGEIDGKGNQLCHYVWFSFSFKCLKMLKKEKEAVELSITFLFKEQVRKFVETEDETIVKHLNCSES